MEFSVQSWLQYLSFTTCIIGFILWFYSRKYAHLPGVFGIPVFGNLYHVVYSLIFDNQTALNARINKILDEYGKLACFWLGPFIIITVADPSLVEELSKHPAAINKEPLVYDSLNVLSKGAFTRSNSDAQWKLYRKDVNNSLVKHLLQSYHYVFVKRSKELVQILNEQNGEFDLKPIICLNCVDMALETQFGLPNSRELLNKNYGLAKDIKILSSVISRTMANPLLSLLAWIILWYFEKKSVHFKKIFDKSFEEIKQNCENYAVIEDCDLPIGAVRVKHNLENNISSEQTKLELKELVFVNAHSLSDILNGLFVLLAVYPEIQEKAWEEQKSIFGVSSREPSHEDIKQMHYLERIIKEACRHLAGPLLPRKFTEEAQIGTYKIPKNSTVLIASYRIRNDPKHWENPTKFDPDNFLPERTLSRHKFANTTFGVFPRHCPGASYVMSNCKVIASAVLRNFKLSSSIKPEELRFNPEILMVLEGPYKISCERRSSKEN